MIRFFAGLVGFGEFFGEPGGPKFFIDGEIFGRTAIVVDGFGGLGVDMNTMAHEGLVDKNEFTSFARKFFPSLPVDVARHFAGKEWGGNFFGVESDGRTTDSVTEAKSEALGPFISGERWRFERGEEKPFNL